MCSKVVILDEADYLTITTQPALITEEFEKHCTLFLRVSQIVYITTAFKMCVIDLGYC